LDKKNHLLENSMKELLKSLKPAEMKLECAGGFITAAIQLYRATSDVDYKNAVLDTLDTMVDSDGAIASLQPHYDINNYAIGNGLFFALDNTKNEKYKLAIDKLATQLESQPRGIDGLFAKDDCGNLEVALMDTYYSQVFYMKYETVFGGKERYNDIISQFNSARKDLYDTVCQGLQSNTDCKALLELAMYSCALIDAMEAMEQPVYEVYHRLMDLVRESLKAMIHADAQDSTCTGALLFAYAIFKACRMKVLHTEKYESYATVVLENAMNTTKDEMKDSTYASALMLAYAESLRNREYQDYGRGRGGVLWN
jgi:rhamnogalacturonyl hydrolase YesR